MTESLWAKRNRQKRFDELVTAALENDEIDRNLRQAHGIDAGYLRKRCAEVSARLWGQVAEAAVEYDEAAWRRDGAFFPAGSLVRDVFTSSRLQYSGALVGLLLVMSAWVVYQPGPMRVRPDYSVVAFAMALIALALATQLVTFESKFRRPGRVRRVVDVVVVPALSMTAIPLFFFAVASLASRQSVERAGASGQGVEAVAIVVAVSLVVVPFIRTLRETRPRPAPPGALPPIAKEDTRSPIIVGAVVASGASGVAVNEGAAALVFGMPNLVLLYGGLGLIMLSALTALVGFLFRPSRLLEQDYKTARGQVSRQLTEIAILPFLRAEINKHTQVLDVEIDVREAPGLGQLSDPAYLVSTAAAARVDKLVETMPGGSIGLAGARGAGKTTLIESYCDGPRRLVNSVATMVSAPVEYASREFLLHLYAKVCRDVIGSRSGVDGLDAVAAVRRGPVTSWVFGLLSIIVGAVLLFLHNEDVRISGQVAWALVLIVVGVVLIGFRAGAHRWPVRVSGRDLRDLAAERLEEIRFQQSFSSTWSGAVKVPLGLEATVGGGRGLIRQPLHLPEIVDSLREFLELVAREHRVLIGIDELDKMESEAAAEQFLNEIKSIFGVRGCYFLVSVSEEAMSSFERRGLPFRDVFDSTFDEIVWFEHLTADEAIASIDRRVLLMPLPFKQLCFALSGGLPRDIIRVARLVLDAQDAQGPTGLSRITTSLVAQDAVRKARAISVAARRLDLEPDVGRFLLVCAGFRDVPIDADSLLRLIDKLLPAGDSRARLESTTAPAGAFLKLVGELACFLYYAATVLDYFDESAGEERWRDTSALHLLAEARQAFSTSTRVAWEGISSFRRSWDMPAVTFPAALGPVPDRLGRRDVGRVVTLAKDATA